MHLFIFIILALSSLLPAIAFSADVAICSVSNEARVSLRAPRYVTVPRDIPIGTRILSEVQGGYAEEISITCPAPVYFRLETRNILPGIAIKFTGPPPFDQINDKLLPAGTTKIRAGEYYFSLTKTAEITPGEIPGGKISTVKAGFNKVMDLMIESIKVTTQSCETPSINVSMGNNYKLTDLNKPQSTTQPIKFKIALNNCGNTIKNIRYKLKPTSSIVDEQQGVINLNGASTARGVGLQITDTNGQPVKFNTNMAYNDFRPGEKEPSINLYANYYHLANEKLEAGTANADIVFSVDYL